MVVITLVMIAHSRIAPPAYLAAPFPALVAVIDHQWLYRAAYSAIITRRNRNPRTLCKRVTGHSRMVPAHARGPTSASWPPRGAARPSSVECSVGYPNTPNTPQHMQVSGHVPTPTGPQQHPNRHPNSPGRPIGGPVVHGARSRRSGQARRPDHPGTTPNRPSTPPQQGRPPQQAPQQASARRRRHRGAAGRAGRRRRRPGPRGPPGTPSS